MFAYDNLPDAGKAAIQLALAAYVNAVHAGEGDVDMTRADLKDALVEWRVVHKDTPFTVELDQTEVESTAKPGVMNAAHGLYVYDVSGPVGEHLGTIVLDE